MTRTPAIIVIATLWLLAIAFCAGYWRGTHAVAHNADLGKVFERMTKAIELACRMSGAMDGWLLADVKLHSAESAERTVTGEFRNVAIECRDALSKMDVVLDTHNLTPKPEPVDDGHVHYYESKGLRLQ